MSNVPGSALVTSLVSFPRRSFFYFFLNSTEETVYFPFLVCFTGGATEFSSMRSSRLVGREINNQTIKFNVNLSTKVAFVLTRGHEVSMVYHSLRNSVLPLCFVTARPP